MPLRRLLGTATGLPGAVARTVTGTVEPRRARSTAGRTRIPVRGVHLPGRERLAEDVCATLRTVKGVTHAEVNAVLGLVMVFDGGDVPVDALIEAVETVEQQHGAQDEPFTHRPHPGDGQAIMREAAIAGAYLAGGGVATVGMLLRSAVSVPPAAVTLLSMADTTPQVRELLERRIGRTATDLGLGAALTVGQMLTQQPFGLAVGAANRLLRLGEMRGHRSAWDRRAGHTEPGMFHCGRVDPGSRPLPLPSGPVERASWSVPAAISAALGTYAMTRDAQRAQGVLAAGVPKAARLGRDAFAARFGRAVAGRGIVVVEPDVLRRLDRVDRVVVDASALRTGDQVIDEVVPIRDAVPAGEAYERAHKLADLDRLDERHEDGPWAVAPLRRGGGFPREPVAALRERGATVLALTRDGEPVALISVLAGLMPLAQTLLARARAVGPVAIAGTGTGLGARLPADAVVPGGNRLLASVRALQEEGHVVALVSARGGAALAAADVGIGVHLGDARAAANLVSETRSRQRHGSVVAKTGGVPRPPWGAHLLCGPGLAEACLLLEALGPAREASRRAARIADVGSVAGTLLAAAGKPETSARRAQLAVDLAAVSSLAVGTWSGSVAGRFPVAVAPDRTPWHAWPVQAVLRRLDSSTSGIGEAEARRRRQSAAGEVPAAPGLLRITADELDNPLTPALAAGAGVSAIMGSVMDAGLIAAVLGVNAVLAGVQRVGADRALRQLVDLSAIRVRIRRPGADGAEATADQLAPGDVIVLAAGDAVPADCRLLSAKALEVDESSLTGESQLVAKSPRPSPAKAIADRSSMLYEGTVVAAGEAAAVVVATGALTEMGRSARLGAERRAGGVETRLRALTEATLPIALGAGGVLFVAELLRGHPVARALGPAVSLAVAAVPEGLPFVATAAELATARRISRRGALVRNPSTVEALGRTDVLCFDKTGTLTEGRLRLRMVSDGESSWPLRSLSRPRREIIAAALRATPGGRRLPHPTDRAIMRGARSLDMDVSEGLGAWERADEMPFEPARGFHAVLGNTPGGQYLSVKGAPEIILSRCRTWAREDGHVRFDPAAREKVEQEVDRLARLGYRVLAVAERKASGRRDLTASRVDRLCLLGLLCIADPVRPTAAEAVDRLRRAGVDIVMITGDHPTTAEAIAAELKLLDGRIMTGADLDAIGDDGLPEAVSGVSVFARVSPAQKARVVRALRSAGRVVAVTGDGANDAPAIRIADVGIALGERATPAARETADMVVTDDRIETITDAIVDCRAMWRSTRDALAVLLGGNLGEIAFTVGTGLVSGASPLNVRQLLLVNLLTDMLPAMALAARPPSGITHEELLAEGPEHSLGGALSRDIAVRAAATAGAAMTAWLLCRASGTRAQADTGGLVALVATQLAQTIGAGGRDPMVLASSLVSLAALCTIVQVPGLSHFFGSRPLLPHGWAVALGSAGGFALAAMLATRLGMRYGPDQG